MYTAKQWKIFFIISGFLAILFTIATLVATYLYEQFKPKDCSACGMASVGLTPLWIISFFAMLVFLTGLWKWLYRQTSKTSLKATLIIVAASPPICILIAAVFAAVTNY